MRAGMGKAGREPAGTLDGVQPWGSPGALGQPPLRIRSKRAQRVFCSIAPSRRAEGGWWECQGEAGGRVRQVGESQGGDAISLLRAWVQSLVGNYDLTSLMVQPK